MEHERNKKFQNDTLHLLNNLKEKGIDVGEDLLLFRKLMNRYMFDITIMEFCSTSNIRNYQKYLDLCEKSIIKMIKE